MNSFFQPLLQHMAWSDERIGSELLASEGKPEAALKWFAHITAAERLWLTRIEGGATEGMAIWPELNAEQCVELAKSNEARYAELLAQLSSEGDFGRLVVYRNSTGAEFRTSVGDILTHVCIHGAYHRGQINSALRGGGLEPVNVDYITYVRENHRSR